MCLALELSTVLCVTKSVLNSHTLDCLYWSHILYDCKVPQTFHLLLLRSGNQIPIIEEIENIIFK